MSKNQNSKSARLVLKSESIERIPRLRDSSYHRGVVSVLGGETPSSRRAAGCRAFRRKHRDIIAESRVVIWAVGSRHYRCVSLVVAVRFHIEGSSPKLRRFRLSYQTDCRLRRRRYLHLVNGCKNSQHPVNDEY